MVAESMVGSFGLLNGRERRPLQTQFPTPGIELRGCDQLGWRTLHANYLKHSEIGISEKIENFPARDLAKTGSRARSCGHETLELTERESPFDSTDRKSVV